MNRRSLYRRVYRPTQPARREETVSWRWLVGGAISRGWEPW